MLKDLVTKARSYRRYDQSYAMSETELKSFVDIARITNSGSNQQPLKYKIICKQPLIDQYFAITKWGGRFKDYNGPAPGEQPTGYIVICCDTQIKAAAAAITDMGIAAEILVLAAAEAGFGSCMIGNFARDKCRELLALADHLEPILTVAFGKPNDEIVLEELSEGEPSDYYRDENLVHHVPKRKLDDILL